MAKIFGQEPKMSNARTRPPVKSRSLINYDSVTHTMDQFYAKCGVFLSPGSQLSFLHSRGILVLFSWYSRDFVGVSWYSRVANDI